ncbi:malto-oligosyltrehalose synthase [Silvibacterium dinghuense]|uniref:Malto-oligosyltrehalose synthase n=1 Tax=Silvibacterium dinghuense TaxID=1560006 RepID=A0A4Q1SGF5_9BACT|nr:malto-oligosyltrehalose synthase [Silvibacterium dinghuense]RXS96596.1 malto-oligosyltrehalose synthase [Silvibacterium dinghuense]GGG92108.1 maltooligosyl trehalose synthase [Silvibacterium dinghuense]
MSESLEQCVPRILHEKARAPLSTYRLQMHAQFSFADAERILPYLRELGIGDIYTSPVFEARPGSTHGYDVARHDRFNLELGGDEGFHRFCERQREAGMGYLLDIVPNHMGVGNDSVWWQDVLENGRASEYSEYFDIDWTPLKPDMQGKLLLPILGQQYGDELEAKHLQIAIQDGRAVVCYYDHIMPLAPRSLPLLFPEVQWEALGMPEGFRRLLRELVHIAPHYTADAELAAQRREQLRELKPRLQAFLADPALRPVFDAVLAEVNGREDDPRSFDQLHEILEAQPYRLALWKVSSEEINYRRFFDVNDLVGLKMENPAVFAATHSLIRKILATKEVTGLRIDHCDGMFNPRQYLIRLQLLYAASQCAGPEAHGLVAPNGIEADIREEVRGFEWSSITGPLYVVVEKILEPREALPKEWPVSGTSGYDFVHFANQVFIQQKNQKKFDQLYTVLLGRVPDPDEIIYRAKLQVMQNALASETYVLTNLLSQLAAANRRVRDFTDNTLETAIRETIACFPVYRTYIDDRGQYTGHDRAVIHHAIVRAKYRSPDIDGSAFDFLEQTLLVHGREGEAIDEKELYFALKFQQLTGPVMAKGVEDTAFYVYTRFLSSNEVGSSMKSFGISIETFHASNEERLANSPDAMLSTSTHDTKRSEDVRNRLNVISELESLWPRMVRRWYRMNAKLRRKIDDGRLAPDANEEYLIYQTVLGAWPWKMDSLEDRKAFVERLKEYLHKALSEAKINLSWVSPNPEYMAAVHGFVEDLLLPRPGRRETQFVESLNGLIPVLRLFGAVNSLAQVALKSASPGVPDFYQGTEMWDLSLVDPDNRRPVDYERRIAALHAMKQLEDKVALCRELVAEVSDGRIKLWTVHRALETRRQLAEVFARGEYIALQASGDASQQVIAFLRRLEGKAVLVAVPRFACTRMRGEAKMPLGEAWGGDTLSLAGYDGRRFLDIFTGLERAVADDGALRLADLFNTFPVAMLTLAE